MSFVLTLTHLELCLSGAQLLGLANFSGGVTRVYTVGWITLYLWLDSSSREIIYLSDVVLVGGIYKEAWLGFLPHEGFPG